MSDAAPEPGNSFTITRAAESPGGTHLPRLSGPGGHRPNGTPPTASPPPFTIWKRPRAAKYRMAFTNFATQETHAFSGVYTELQPHRRIRTSADFDDPSLPGQLTMTVDIEETIAGAQVTVTQSGLPPQIPPEYAVLGWQESLDQLRLLVEPEIPSAG